MLRTAVAQTARAATSGSPAVRAFASTLAAPAAQLRPVVAARQGLRSADSRRGAAHEAESFDAFNARYVKFFETCDEQFELMRGLNNCFSYDLVPSLEVVEAALRASRRCNDYAMAVRIFEGLKDKVENLRQYDAYLRETEALRKELGVETHESLYGIAPKKPGGMLSSV